MDDVTVAKVTDQLRRGADNLPPGQAAAVHLAISVGLVERPQFHLQLTLDDTGDQTAAYVSDWPALADIATERHLGGAGHRLIALAIALATGQPVNVRDCLTGLGAVHTRYAIEAVIIAAGAEELYRLEPTFVIPIPLEPQR